jgi:hypothetical protein
MVQHLELLQQEGLSGSIYTQAFDVESEQNGLMTYDREVVKIPFEDLRRIHARLNPDMGMVPPVTAAHADLTDPALHYSHMLREYIDGRHDSLFLKELAMAAIQIGDQQGESQVGSAYAALLKAPLSEEDIKSVAQFTQSSKDAGFRLMVDNAAAFRQVLGDRPYTVALMNILFKGEIEPLLALHPTPDWTEIRTDMRVYGVIGDEIVLRAETIEMYNRKDWNDYVPVANEYLEKFGKNLNQSERSMFQDAIDKNK